MRATRMGRPFGSVTVTASTADVRAFAARWPGFGAVRGPVTFEFDRRGDLIDVEGDKGYDESGVRVLSEDAQDYAARQGLLPSRFRRNPGVGPQGSRPYSPPPRGRYAWRITREYLGGAGGEGVEGPRHPDPKLIAKLDRGEGRRFRLYDDDGVLYCEGRIVGPDAEYDEFAPLDDFGEPALGATEIRYHIDGKWVTI